MTSSDGNVRTVSARLRSGHHGLTRKKGPSQVRRIGGVNGLLAPEDKRVLQPPCPPMRTLGRQRNHSDPIPSSVATTARRGSAVHKVRRPTSADASRCTSTQPTPRPWSRRTRTKVTTSAMRHLRRLMHLRVVRQQRPAAALVANQQLAVDERVAAHFVSAEEILEGAGHVGRAVGEETNPDRRVHQHHHATERLAARGGSCAAPGDGSRARGSLPRSARSRSVRRMTHERFEAETNRIGVGRGAARRPGLAQQLGRRCGGSSSYSRICHRCMAVVAIQRVERPGPTCRRGAQ